MNRAGLLAGVVNRLLGRAKAPDKQTIPLPHSGDARARKPLITLVIEAFSVIVAIGAVVGIAINSAIFDQWGLSYLRLATLSDVATGSLQILNEALPCIILVAAGAGLEAAIASPWRYRLGNIISNLFLFVWICAGVAIALTLVKQWFSVYAQHILEKIEFYVVFIDLLYTAFFFGYLFATLAGVGEDSIDLIEFIRRLANDLRQRPFRTLPAAVSIAFLLFGGVAFIYWITIGVYISGTAKRGYFQHPIILSDERASPKCPIPRVIWSGEASLVYVCRDKLISRDDIHIIFTPQSIYAASEGHD